MQAEFWSPPLRYSQSFLFLFDDEVWKIVADFPDHEVSDFGRVKNIFTDEIRKGTTAGTGYVHVGLFKAGRIYTCQVHRLVAKAFLPPPRPDQELVNHKNRIKTDNRAGNLEWVTRRENAIHAWTTPKPVTELNGRLIARNGISKWGCSLNNSLSALEPLPVVSGWGWHGV